jgi:hypothetical protein
MPSFLGGLFSKRSAPPDTDRWNSVNQGAISKDDVTVKPSNRRTLPSLSSNGYKAAGAGPTEVWLSPTGRSQHGGTGMNVATFVSTEEIRRRDALKEPDAPARTLSSELAPELNRVAYNSHKALYPQLHEMLARVSIESTEDAANDATAALEAVKGGAAEKTSRSAVPAAQALQWSPQGESLTSAKNTALLGAIDSIGNALSKKLGQESIACAIHELEQLLDQARPISRCEVPDAMHLVKPCYTALKKALRAFLSCVFFFFCAVCVMLSHC